MQRSGQKAKTEIISFPQPPDSHCKLICHGIVDWRVAILYDILKEIGGGDWLVSFVALGKLAQVMKYGDGSYYFAWRGYIITVRFASIELRVSDSKRGDLIEQLRRLDQLIKKLDQAIGDRSPNRLNVHRSERHRLLCVTQTRRRDS
ncbi:MAG: hypothetical protein AAB337_00395 [Patescibacteria group bacterium]